MHNKAIESRLTQKITLFDLLETVVSPPQGNRLRAEHKYAEVLTGASQFWHYPNPPAGLRDVPVHSARPDLCKMKECT